MTFCLKMAPSITSGPRIGPKIKKIEKTQVLANLSWKIIMRPIKVSVYV